MKRKYDVDKFMKRQLKLPFEVTPAIWLACRYLERNGYHFLGDFGFCNAKEIMRREKNARKNADRNL